jgi:hypothetical protein
LEEIPTLPPRPPRPVSLDESPIDASTPIGIEATQKIRSYFHIPAEIKPSGFVKFFEARARISEGMTLDKSNKILTSPTTGLHDVDPKLIKKRKPSFFTMTSREDDFQRRIEMTELCARIQWPEYDEPSDEEDGSWEEGSEAGDDNSESSDEEKSSWEEGSEDEEDNDDELDTWRNFETQRLLKNVLDNIAANPRSRSSYAAGSAGMNSWDLPGRPKTPSPDHERWNSYEYEDPNPSLDPIDHSFSDEDVEQETQPRLLVVSAPVSEDPKSPHDVKERSPLRVELVLFDRGSKEEDE